MENKKKRVIEKNEEVAGREKESNEQRRSSGAANYQSAREFQLF